MKQRFIHIRRWLATLHAKLIVASLLVSLVPTAIAAELAVRLVTGLLDHDVQEFLHETSVFFLSNFKESQAEASSLARYLYEQRHSANSPEITADQAFLGLSETLGYRVVIVSERDSHKVVYANYPVRGFEPLSVELSSSLWVLQLPNRTQILSGGTYPYEAQGKQYEILVGNWLDENFIDNLRSVTSIDLRLYYLQADGFRMIYSSRSENGGPLPEDASAALEEGIESYYDPQADDGRQRVIYLPIRNRKGEMIGVMSAGLRATEVPTIWDLPINILVAMFISGTVLTAVAGLFISRRLSRPLRALSDGVQSITEGDYHHRVEASGDDEVASLAKVFNHMAERLEQLQSLESELRRRDRLSALGEVAVGIAHEIRNPLGTIKTSTELVRRRDGLTASDGKLLGYVIDEVRRIDALIEEFLSFARPRAPILRTICMAKVIERIATFCEPELSRHNVEVSFDDQSGGALVQADEDHLFQAGLNLVLNAIDAMDGGGHLSVRITADNTQVRASFSDTGQGIAPEVQDKIFNPFFTTKPKGTGLGLAKVFSVMESHNGRVDCVSQVGLGTTFTLILPRCAK